MVKPAGKSKGGRYVDPDEHRARGEQESFPLASAARARRTDPQTSRDAAREVTASGLAGEQGETVLRFLHARKDRHLPPLTSREIADGIEGLDRYQVARRLPELEEAHKVRRCEPRKCSLSPRAATTWEAV